jgi:hypothetical protein
MADIVNLRTVRKQKARVEREQTAAENRALYGQTKADKTLARQQAEKAARFIEARRIVRVDGKTS